MAGSEAVLVLHLDPADPVARLGEWLAAAGLRLEVRDAAGGVPGSLAGYAGLVVMGGGVAAWEDERAPFLPAVRALLREAVSTEVPTLGVCLGAQLLALAHGGRVERNPEGPEYGALLVAKRAAASTDPLFRELPITPDVIQWHTDAVVTLPAGAIQLAGSPTCENQAYRLGRLAWGIQFHIETTPQLVRQWAADDAEQLRDYDVERILARADAVHDDLAEVWQPFAAAFAAVVRDPAAVPAARPLGGTAAGAITDPAAIRAALAAEATAAHQHRPALPFPTTRPDAGG